MAVARLYVLDSVVLLGHPSQALGQQFPVAYEQGQLAAPGLEGRAVHADHVAYIERSEQLEGFAPQDVELGLDLQLARAVDHVDEGSAAMAAASQHPAGYPVGGVGLLAGLEVVVGGVDASDRHDAVELVREGVDPLLAQALELGPAVVHRRRDPTATGQAPRGMRNPAQPAEPAASGRGGASPRMASPLDLGDLQLAGGPARNRDGHGVAPLVAEQGAADRRLVREPALG